MTLGPITRTALVESGLDEKLVEGIEAGTLEWEIGRSPAIGVSASEESAREMSRAAAARKDFTLIVSRTEAEQQRKCPWDLSRRGRRVYETAVPNEHGQRVARARHYEEALAARGDAVSSLLSTGSMDDWTSVAHAQSWDALAFEFRRAAEAVANTHTVHTPAPALVLLALCRHHVELALKAIIMAGDRLAGNPVDLPTKHPLTPLWNRAEPLMRTSWAVGWDESEFQSARGVVKDLDSVDASGMATRYPVDKGNTPFTRPALLANFSVATFMGAFTAASDFLGTATLWIEVGLLAKEVARDEQVGDSTD